MKTEFLAVCIPIMDIRLLPQAIQLQLEIVLQEYYESYSYNSLILSTADVSEMVTVTLEREAKDEQGNVIRRIYGFQIEFRIETESLTPSQFQDTISHLEQIIQNLSDNIREYKWVKHLVKFYDDVLLESHLAKMREVHEIEMKLRQVLSIIYLAAFDDEKFFNLLRFEKEAKPKIKVPDEDTLKRICENEFYYLVFGQYPRLNKKKDLKDHKELIELVLESGNYDELKNKLINDPIKNEVDADLIKSLNDTSPKIEDFRNCVAHNRRLSEDMLTNYLEAKGLLTERLDKYLEQFSISDIEV